MAKGAVIGDAELKKQATGYYQMYLALYVYTLHLYVNDHSPAPGDILANYTECTTPGYAAQPIPPAGWSVADPMAHAVLINQENPRRFVPDAGATPVLVYGYYVTDNAGVLAWAEAFTTPQSFQPGDFLDVRPKYRFANCAVP